MPAIHAPTTSMVIDGVSYSADQMASAGIEVDWWGWDLESGDLDAEFSESGPALADTQSATFAPGIPVEVLVDGTRRFFGAIVGFAVSGGDGQPWRFGYRCGGPKYLLNRHQITAASGVGRLAYNLDPRSEDYVESLAGLALGDILDDVLTVHASQLAAAGISTDATTASQLAALALVPVEPVYLAGRLAQAIDGLLRRWARTKVFTVNGAGKVRIVDYTTGTVRTLSEGDDPIQPVRLGVDLRNCATRVVVRGGANAAPYYATLANDTLVPAWSGAQQTAWSWADHANPEDAFDKGAITGIASGGTVLTLDPTDAARTWATNFWPSREGWIVVEKSVGTGLTFTESRPVIANTSLSAGGTATVTLAYGLDNAGTGAYDRYTLIGTAGPLTGTGASRADVWRLFNVETPGGLVEGALLPRFGTEVPFAGYYGDSVVTTRNPAALLVGNGIVIPATFKILPQTGQIRFDRPVCQHFNSQATLDAGGDGVAPPDDIYVMLAYSRGALQAVHPPDSGGPVYSGDAFDAFGYEATHWVDVEDWLYQGDLGRFEDYAEMLHAALSVPKWSGSATVLGAYADGFEPPLRLSIDAAACGPSYDTGHGSLAAPVRAFRLVYHRDGAGGVLHHSELSLDTQRDPSTGDEIYVHATTLEDLNFKFPGGGQLDLSGMVPRITAQGLFQGGLNYLNQTMAGNVSQLHQPTSDLSRIASDQAGAPGRLGSTAQGSLGDILARIDAFLRSLPS